MDKKKGCVYQSYRNLLKLNLFTFIDNRDPILFCSKYNMKFYETFVYNIYNTYDMCIYD